MFSYGFLTNWGTTLYDSGKLRRVPAQGAEPAAPGASAAAAARRPSKRQASRSRAEKNHGAHGDPKGKLT